MSRKQKMNDHITRGDIICAVIGIIVLAITAVAWAGLWMGWIK